MLLFSVFMSFCLYYHRDDMWGTYAEKDTLVSLSIKRMQWVFPKGVIINIWVLFDSAKANLSSCLLFQFFFSAFLIFCLFCILSLGYLLCFFSLMQMYVSLQIYCTGNITMSWAKTGPRITDRKVIKAKEVFSAWNFSTSYFSFFTAFFRRCLGATVDGEVL